jgi:hypothetical protein
MKLDLDKSKKEIATATLEANYGWPEMRKIVFAS